jgi:hypothetical protein
MQQRSEIPTMPAPMAGGVPTLNGMGYMTLALDPYSRAFVSFASRSELPVLDVGAAYGIATLAALAEGATVIANDLDPRHLEILMARTPPADRPRLHLAPGEFPYQPRLLDGTIGAALVSRVFHFFPGARILSGLRRLHHWLAPGGRLYVVALSPFLLLLREFVPVYQARKARGLRWPGWTTDPACYAPAFAGALPEKLHLFEPDLLGQALEGAGFTVREARFFRPPDLPEELCLDGREAVGVIAER